MEVELTAEERTEPQFVQQFLLLYGNALLQSQNQQRAGQHQVPAASIASALLPSFGRGFGDLEASGSPASSHFRLRSDAMVGSGRYLVRWKAPCEILQWARLRVS